MSEFDKIMSRAFRLAAKGLGYTSPNPPVGAILFRDGEIVGAGYHRRAGQPHAEIEAIKAAGERACGAALVTTLEPCSHHGKTPPCAEAVIAAGITKVISAISDPNPVVSGKGFAILKNAGVEVVEGVQEDQARKFYRPYFKYITSGYPFVTLKYAQSIDGRIATKTGHSQWISSPESLIHSHRLRAVNDAVVIGSGTLKKDDPKLTTRLVKGPNPVRIVLSQSGKVPLKKAIFTDGESPTLLATGAPGLDNRDGYELLPVKKSKDGLSLENLLSKLGKMGIMTLLVEGGSGVLTSFLKRRLADRVVVCIAPMIIGEGIEAVGDLGIRNLNKSIRLEGVETIKSGPDIIMSGYPVWK